MLDVKKNTLRSHPSLLQLRMALIAAESESPSHPLHGETDVNEQLALQLIAGVKKEYKKPRPFLNLNDLPSQHGFRKDYQVTVTQQM